MREPELLAMVFTLPPPLQSAASSELSLIDFDASPPAVDTPTSKPSQGVLSPSPTEGNKASPPPLPSVWAAHHPCLQYGQPTTPALSMGSPPPLPSAWAAHHPCPQHGQPTTPALSMGSPPPLPSAWTALCLVVCGPDVPFPTADGAASAGVGACSSARP